MLTDYHGVHFKKHLVARVLAELRDDFSPLKNPDFIKEAGSQTVDCDRARPVQHAADTRRKRVPMTTAAKKKALQQRLKKLDEGAAEGQDEEPEEEDGG